MKSMVDCPYWHLAGLTVIPLLKLLELCCTGGRHAVQSDEALSAEGEAYSDRNVTASVTLLFFDVSKQSIRERKICVNERAGLLCCDKVSEESLCCDSSTYLVPCPLARMSSLDASKVLLLLSHLAQEQSATTTLNAAPRSTTFGSKRPASCWCGGTARGREKHSHTVLVTAHLSILCHGTGVGDREVGRSSS